MTNFLIGITVFAHLILPLIFLLWVLLSRVSSKMQWLTVAAIAGSYLLVMWAAGAGWGWFGDFWPVLFLCLYLVIAPVAYYRRRKLPWIPAKNWKPWAGFALLAGFFVLFVTGIPSAYSAREYKSGDALALTFPLRGGTFHVAHGGANETMNNHYRVPAQRFALDIQMLNEYGIRAHGLMPKDLTAYAIYGAVVVAPCTGEVISAENARPDQEILKMDGVNLLGNHVIVFCGEHSVVLAHLKQNSVNVKTGDQVKAGDVLGQAGNSGNTSEPHLHIHAVRGRHTEKAEIAGSAEGVPMTFAGRFLVRNDHFRNP